jgi:prolyl 4-hydroxylase
MSQATTQILPQTGAVAEAAVPLQPVTPELRQWIVEQAEAGCRPADVVQAMIASGWQEAVAIAAMERTLREHLATLDRQAGRAPLLMPAATAQQPGDNHQPLPEPVAVPQPLLDSEPSVLLAAGHAVRVLTTMTLPRVVVFGGLLTDEECVQLMAQADPRLKRSETVDNNTGGSEVNPARTSDGMFFERGETPLIQRIENRIAALVNWPMNHGEGLQILRYRPGAEYRPHHDYFDPQHLGSIPILKRGGQRVATLVMYLNTPEGGGATTFPEVGLTVAPVRGNAVFFSYDRAHPCTRTLHGGAPVLAGEKWVATKWLRQGVFI